MDSRPQQIQRSFRHHGRVLCINEVVQTGAGLSSPADAADAGAAAAGMSQRQQPAGLTANKHGMSDRFALETPKMNPTKSTLVAIQGYFGDATLVEFQQTHSTRSSRISRSLAASTDESAPAVAIYATRLGRSLFSFATAYQVSLAFWVALSFMGWCVVTVTVLFVLIFQSFAWQAAQNTSYMASVLSLLTAAVPSVLYLLSLVSFHLFVLEDVLLNLTHASEIALYVLKRGCCEQNKGAFRRVAPIYLVIMSVLLGVFVLVLNSALVVAIVSGSSQASQFLAACISALMASLAAWHIMCLGCFPCIRYSPGPGGKIKRCVRAMWLRAGLVCANTLWSVLLCSCLCFKHQPDISKQASHIRQQFLMWNLQSQHSGASISASLGQPAGLPPLPPRPPFVAPQSSTSSSPTCTQDINTSHSLVSFSSNPTSDQLQMASTFTAGRLHTLRRGRSLPLDSVQKVFDRSEEAEEDENLSDSDSSLGAQSLLSSSSTGGDSCSVHSIKGASPASQPLRAAPSAISQSTSRKTLAKQLGMDLHYASESKRSISSSSSPWPAARTGKRTIVRSASFRSASAARFDSPQAAHREPEGRISAQGKLSTSYHHVPGLWLPAVVAGRRTQSRTASQPTQCPLPPGLLRSAAKIMACWGGITAATAIGGNADLLLQGIAVGWPVSMTVWLLVVLLHFISDGTASLPTCCSMCCIDSTTFRREASVHVANFRSAAVPGLVGFLAAAVRAGSSGAVASSLDRVATAGLACALTALGMTTGFHWCSLLFHHAEEHSAGTRCGRLFQAACLLDDTGVLQGLSCCSGAGHDPPSEDRKALDSLKNKWFWYSAAFFAFVLCFAAAAMPALSNSPQLAVLLVLSSIALGTIFINGLPTHGSALTSLQQGEDNDDQGVAQSLQFHGVSPAFSDGNLQKSAPQPRVAPELIMEDSSAYAVHGAVDTDPISTVLFAEKQLRWSFVLPVFLVAFVAAMVTSVLLDSGTNSQTTQFAAWARSQPVGPTQDLKVKPGMCHVATGSLSVVDLALLSRASYLAAQSAEYPAAISALFPERAVTTVFISKEQENKPVYSILTFGASPGVEAPNTTVISVRGSAQGFDWAQSLYTWGPSMMAQAVQYLLPLLRPLRYTETDEILLGRLAQMETTDRNRQYDTIEPFYVPITRVASALQRATRSDKPEPLLQALRAVNVDPADVAAYNLSAPLGSSLVLTGHSLGGGVAMIAGASADVAAVSYSGPGPVLGRERYQRSIDAACPECKADLSSGRFELSGVNIAPSGDIVPWVGGQPRSTSSLGCAGSFSECHTMTRTACELIAQCGDMRGRSFVDFSVHDGSSYVERCCIGGVFNTGHDACVNMACAEHKSGSPVPASLVNLCSFR